MRQASDQYEWLLFRPVTWPSLAAAQRCRLRRGAALRVTLAAGPEGQARAAMRGRRRVRWSVVPVLQARACLSSHDMRRALRAGG